MAEILQRAFQMHFNERLCIFTKVLLAFVLKVELNPCCPGFQTLHLSMYMPLYLCPIEYFLI